MDQELNAQFRWECQPQAEKFVLEKIAECRENLPYLAHLEEQLNLGCSCSLISILDHFVLKDSKDIRKKLKDVGYVLQGSEGASDRFTHPGAMLPPILLKKGKNAIYLSVESIAHFFHVRGEGRAIEGTPYSPYRQALVEETDKACFFVVERRGCVESLPVKSETETYHILKEQWMMRPRPLEGEEEALDVALKLARKIADQVGKGLAASLILECERSYWQAKNRAGQVQKLRQDAVGIGWANHDHHTFRSSRRHFPKLVKLFESIGFHCRERFYAGQEAGWGAQVMENPEARLVLFLDVDLSPDEIAIDFAHKPLPERKELGTIGLWCALHGDSILRAGMHHLEAQFLFDGLKVDLKQLGVGFMAPFSNFTYLKQAFSEGELWAVDEKRIDSLLKSGQITKAQAERFRTAGAVGSHLENLERHDGYKGFNQKNVSIIIEKTDPRHLIISQTAPSQG